MLKSLGPFEEKLHLMKLNLARLAGTQPGAKVLDVGCGQGTFTACLAELVGEAGEVTAVDISDENLDKLSRNLDKYDVRSRVKFVKADAAQLTTCFSPGSFDLAVAYRLIEELKQPKQLSKILSSLAEVVRRGGMVVMFELSTETKDIAEENLVRLHRDIGDDYFPSSGKILSCLKAVGLIDVDLKIVPTHIAYSGKVFLESDVSQDEVWPEFRERIMKELWPSIEQFGMRYPDIREFFGRKP